ncbi:hypothetical protein [Streptomyces sp. S1D4-14]|uniref:hypothetical protein n=1 Tax=Streptomyces sp. S1D4-14 TaxID=2594461 RepID=UPI0011637868|nr:hypothetical protein [Streptomyces sp. S1D4-14]QDN64492.1 hypothetical protein FNV66_01265 [Streptomyces sp. S1D4-14]
MKGSMREIRDEEERMAELAARVAELLNEMDRLAPGLVALGPGVIRAPGAEIRRALSGGFTVRS